MTGSGQSVETRRLSVDPHHPDPDEIEVAAAVLRAGGLVAFPTETVYGLGADARSSQAVLRLFAAKGRPADNPLIIHIGSIDDAAHLAREVPPLAHRLMDRFWPGPLTLVLPKHPEVPAETTAGLDTVALRMPEHPVAHALLQRAGVAIAAPSANRSGRPSPTTAEHVWTDLAGRIDVLLDAGPTQVGVESTVVQVDEDQVTVLRLGSVTPAMIREVADHVEVHPHARGVEVGMDEVVASPGTKHRHYAPSVPVRLFEGDDRIEALRSAWVQARDRGQQVGIIATDESGLTNEHVKLLGPRDRPEEYARGLYAALRALDDESVDVILVEGIEAEGLGAAVMDRLRRAAKG